MCEPFFPDAAVVSRFGHRRQVRAPFWTDEDVDTLKTAYKQALLTGVLTVNYSGPPARSVTYRSTAEMWQTLQRVLAAVDAARGRGAARYFVVSGGFDR